ncbi:MAG TPA: cyclic beta 1-2 glucan synthetase, partial [Bacteroidetes bacterium]|nr:cyclic beta 1-2 glucan synthetase [Bacteroidota bacterium]
MAHELISDLRGSFQTNNSKQIYLDEEPLRAELYSSYQLERLGKSLAGKHVLSTQPVQDHLLWRLADNESILQEVRKLLTESIKKKQRITPAGEWLIDNFYLIEEHIRIAKIHFPKGYSENLPQISDNTSTGLTRVYSIVLHIISHSDGRVDIESLSRFIQAYQSVSFLKLGELWAIPIMLRLALIENLRRVAVRLAIDKIDSNLADYWARKMSETAEHTPKNLILLLADMARSNPPMVSAFVSEFTRQLRGKGPDLALALSWIERQLFENGLSTAELVNEENQKQAADQVSMSNSIGSLRLLDAIDWREFVEGQSVVENILREDRNNVYALMDFSTRDRYRHVVEHLAHKSNLSEPDVARLAISLALEADANSVSNQEHTHVGYYLIGNGIDELKLRASVRESFFLRAQHACRKQGLGIYIGSIVLLSLLISIGIFFRVRIVTSNEVLLAVLTLLTFIAVGQLAISVVNFISTLIVKPRLLPRLDFSKHIPETAKTLVIIPSMLGSFEEAEDLIESLEVRYLANRNENLHFGLLTDFPDALQETLPSDQPLLSQVKRAIEALNKKYGRVNNDLFYLFHRPRQWNPRETRWMGYERKRGKIEDLNALLRGSGTEKFSFILGEPSIFPAIRYVITLDADTQLPLGTAWKLIGTIAHPLNRPWYDEKKQRVVKGYGIMQPRVAVSLPEGKSTPYTRMHGNEAGIDPYTRATSDVYQDLFGEGSFIGKGIYDVDTFRKVLENRFPENIILSHDLLEGCYVRSGLMSDVLLYEKYPGTYNADMKRRSRWIRGDWQIFSWILPYVPGPAGSWVKNPVSGLSRWKIFDNIRRSVVPPALTLLLILAWLSLPSVLFWTLLVSGIIILPILIAALWNIIKKPKEIIFWQHVGNSLNSIYEIIKSTLFTLVSLPFEAYTNTRAILRTLWRMLVSRKKLLEWNPSINEEKKQAKGLLASYSVMWIEPFLALVLFAYFVIYIPEKLLIAGPILILWISTPWITWWLSQPSAPKVEELSDNQTLFLRKLARKTFSYFEEFVVQNDHFLPPDNFQEQPVAYVAHRTSPTNIGLALLANVAAHDFGYITHAIFLERTKDTLSTMGQMDRYRGHFYNWYDTETLEPLLPRYISTVDSGNLAGHLLILKQHLLALPERQILTVRALEGLQDTLLVFADLIDEKQRQAFITPYETLNILLEKQELKADELKILLEQLREQFHEATENWSAEENPQAAWWKQRMMTQLGALEESLLIFTPWQLIAKAPPLFNALSPHLMPNTYEEVSKISGIWMQEIEKYKAPGVQPEESDWLDSLSLALKVSYSISTAQIREAEDLANQCEGLADMDWTFLYEQKSNLFAIGYNVQEHLLDPGFYDLLASEARFGIYMGIAQGKLPIESWFALGRLLTRVNKKSILLSWSGSMFEYLMPNLVMPSYENTLLDQTCKAAVQWQIDYGKQTGLPWGISESGFNRINANLHYQYRAFGAPGLGLKRGLEDDRVVAPYASAMALMVAPRKACQNLELLREKGMEGRFGLYEAIDYTPARLQRGQASAIVYSFMAHHQGMSLLSLAYLLLDKPMQKLFEAEPQFKAVLLLLQERIPRTSSFFAHTSDIADIAYAGEGAETRIITSPHTLLPDIQLLSNGRYHVMLTNSGAGYSKWNDLAVTRWREDGTRDNWGTFVYIRDVETEEYWSNTFHPTRQKTDTYEVAYSQGRVDYRSSRNKIDTHTEIVVSPEDDIEMRRLRITNNSNETRIIEITSYAEVVIAPGITDIMQPSFSNLFVETEIVPQRRAIICSRRPRSSEEVPPWMFHLMTLQGKSPEEVSYETDRNAFIGRGNTIENPQAMQQGGALSGREGPVLDPIVAIRYKISMEPDEVLILDLVTGMAKTKELCNYLIGKYQDKHHKDRVFELAWTHSQVVLRQINASEADAQLYGRLASPVLYMNALFRADPAILISNRRQQSGLWGYSISGDLPIVLLKIERVMHMDLVRQMVQAHAYWRLKGLYVDLVIWNEEHDGYRQLFQNEIEALIPSEYKDKPGGVFVRASDQISHEDRILFQTVARVLISDHNGSLQDHVNRKPAPRAVIPHLVPKEEYKYIQSAIPFPQGLLFDNGIGGFSSDGKEYVITLEQKKRTPAPWVNVIANSHFGTVISESGSAYTWTENAHELRLTPWNSDPVSDTGGEVFYIRDFESGRFWSTTILPAGSDTTYITRHGFGYSVFEHAEDGIFTEMTVFVDLDEAVKFNVIRIKNVSGRKRQLSATGYMEWVLDNNRSKTMSHIHTEIDPESGAFFAKNPYNTEFHGRVAFFDVDYLKKSFTGDRTEFIGRNGNLQKPEALFRQRLSGKVGLAMDPCAAIQVPFDLGDGEEIEVIFRLGAGINVNAARSTVRKFRGTESAKEAFEKVRNYWTKTLGSLQIETPDKALNLITNGWLTYQTLASRLWGRSGFYQSGGAFGFRDQLQDVMSILQSAPEIARAQILLHASRQFTEGDVQHWWHPPSGNGVRTRCSDDYLWLPYVTSIYVQRTGDQAILDEEISFIHGRTLNENEESHYDLPLRSPQTATLYAHCVLAIKNGFKFGERGLPLIGAGDWNDGFDKVGHEGKGESVWMAFFLHETLLRFSKIARGYQDAVFAEVCITEAELLKANIDKHAWDGAWYKRAWFDDGTALGSSQNTECRIDSISQSWSVLSGAGNPERTGKAMESAYTHLVRKETGIIQLLDPPFDETDLNPGYIKGYVPGVRENGGQYTHAAIWTA